MKKEKIQQDLHTRQMNEINQMENEEIDQIIADSVNEIIELIAPGIHDTPVVTKKQQQEKLELELKECLHSHFKKVEDGAAGIFNKLAELSKNDSEILSNEVAEEIKDFGQKLGNFMQHADQFVSEIEKDKSLKEIFGLSHQTMRSFYRAAAEIYKEKQYVHAAEAFCVLAILDPAEYLFWFGLGNSEYYCQHYEQALNAYAMAIHINPEEPLNYIFSANCYEAIHEYDNAINSLNMALYLLEESPSKYPDAKAKITEHKKSLENKLK